jgi:hypothetical protein
MTAEEKARYFELLSFMQTRKLSDAEANEVDGLARAYAVVLRTEFDEKAAARKAELAAQAKDKREAGEVADYTRETGHQISYLRAALKIKVDDQELARSWHAFKTHVESP